LLIESINRCGTENKSQISVRRELTSPAIETGRIEVKNGIEKLEQDPH